MHRAKRSYYLNKNGYTLLEALFHLIVFVLLSNFFILITAWINQMDETLLVDEHVAWELFIQDFQNYIVDVEQISTSTVFKKINIDYLDSNETNQIELFGSVIRLQKNQEGHVPLLLEVKDADFKMNNNFLTISVIFMNGIKKERTFFVQTAKK